MGRISKEKAFGQAVEANLWLASQLSAPRLIDRLTGNHIRTVGTWATAYEKELEKRPLAENTRRSYKSLLRRTQEVLGPTTPLRNITALMISEEVAKIEDKPRTAQAWRSFLKDYFRSAIVQGWIDENPVRDVRSAKVVVKRARLTLGVLRQVYEAAQLPWLKNAIALPLLSGQRREDLTEAKVADFREGVWWITQGKSGMKLAIPMELRLDAFGMSLQEVYEQCRRTGVLSKYLIHQTEKRGNSPVGRQIWKDTVSRRFTETLERLGIDWGEKTPPTFHAIRSLSERLYSAQGGVDTQQLLGHRNLDTTLLYHNSRGAEYVRVRIESRGV